MRECVSFQVRKACCCVALLLATRCKTSLYISGHTSHPTENVQSKPESDWVQVFEKSERTRAKAYACHMLCVYARRTKRTIAIEQRRLFSAFKLTGLVVAFTRPILFISSFRLSWALRSMLWYFHIHGLFPRAIIRWAAVDFISQYPIKNVPKA